MENMKYNIVWADDEIRDLLSESTKDLFESEGIRVVEGVGNAFTLKTFLDRTPERIDAVVVDSNFPYQEFTSNKEKDTLGLQMISQWVHTYESKYPFIVYTGRRNLMEDEIGQTLFSYFHRNNLIVTKNASSGISDLIAKIKEVVDRRNSVEWIIGNQYTFTLLCADTFDRIASAKSKQLLLEILIESHQNTLHDTERYFNQLRSEILEKMNALAARFGVVPEGLSLNDFSKFLCRTNEAYQYAEEEVLPKALQEVIRYTVRMTQDGSHGTGKLVLFLHQYISRTNNTLLIRSVCYAVMELLEWFMRYLTEHTDRERNLQNWNVNNEITNS